MSERTAIHSHGEIACISGAKPDALESLLANNPFFRNRYFVPTHGQPAESSIKTFRKSASSFVLTYNRGFQCAVKGAGSQRGKTRPGTGSLHPVAMGTVVEVTKLLKPLV